MDASTVRGAAAIGLTAAAACLPVLAVVVPLAVAPLFAVTALLGVVAAVTSDRARRLGHATLLFAIVAAWSFLSASWAIEPSATLRLAAVVTLTLTGGLSLLRVAATMTPVEKRRLEAALVAGVVVALGLLAVEAVGRTVSRISPQRWVLEAIGRRFDTTALNRGLAVIAILIWPVALILWRQVGRWAAPLPPLLLAAILPTFESGTAGLALAAGLALSAAAAACGRQAFAILGVTLAVVVMTAPLLPRVDALHALLADRSRSVSVWHRAEIWRFTAERIADRPVLGWGLNAARAIPGGKERIDGRVERMPLHPHNAILQIWLELGAVGAACAMAMILAALYRLLDVESPATRMAGIATLGAALGVASSGYGLWQSWWLSTLLLIAAIAVATREATSREGARDR